MNIDFDEFVALCSNPADDVDLTFAVGVEQQLPIYDGSTLASADGETAEALRAELAAVFRDGPGALVVRHAWDDQDVLDRATELFWQLIEAERTDHPDMDHFAAAGANSRVWDSLGKMAAADPDLYVDYYANPALHLVCEAWLGPWYQPTAQVNIVHPGGAAQSPHRDYHLGFLSDADARRFPSHVHRLSPYLTLQLGIAHADMPIESGPTMLLPGSQRFAAGYLAWRDERFKQYFAEHRSQVALNAGDAVFFSPAIFHGAGHNRTTDRERVGNLMQVSSAFGVPMEAIDWTMIARQTYPRLLALAAENAIGPQHVAMCAQGYAFPSNLDTDPADAGLAPPSAQHLLAESLAAGVDTETFVAALEALVERKRAFSGSSRT